MVFLKRCACGLWCKSYACRLMLSLFLSLVKSLFICTLAVYHTFQFCILIWVFFLLKFVSTRPSNYNVVKQENINLCFSILVILALKSGVLSYDVSKGKIIFISCFTFTSTYKSGSWMEPWCTAISSLSIQSLKRQGLKKNLGHKWKRWRGLVYNKSTPH